MTYQPVVPLGGNAGWAFLKRTRDDQQAAFVKSKTFARDVDYFRAKIGQVKTAEDLVSDRRLLSVALGAFGLDEDLPNRAYIRKVLEEGTIAEDSFANKLADKRYFAFAKALGFDLSPPNTAKASFVDDTVAAYEDRQFEIAVGQTDQGLRLALGFGRDVTALAEKSTSERSFWYGVMANRPLRTVFEGALGLPPGSSLDVDKLVTQFEDRAASVFGEGGRERFADPEVQEDAIRKYLLRESLDLTSAATSSGRAALSLLQAAPRLYPPLYG